MAIRMQAAFRRHKARKEIQILRRKQLERNALVLLLICKLQARVRGRKIRLMSGEPGSKKYRMFSMRVHMNVLKERKELDFQSAGTNGDAIAKRAPGGVLALVQEHKQGTPNPTRAPATLAEAWGTSETRIKSLGALGAFASGGVPPARVMPNKPV